MTMIPMPTRAGICQELRPRPGPGAAFPFESPTSAATLLDTRLTSRFSCADSAMPVAGAPAGTVLVHLNGTTVMPR